MNILRVKRKSTVQVFFVAILAPVSAQLIQTLDWDQNSGVRLVFGLSKKTERKTKTQLFKILQPRFHLSNCICLHLCTEYYVLIHKKFIHKWRKSMPVTSHWCLYEVKTVPKKSSVPKLGALLPLSHSWGGTCPSTPPLPMPLCVSLASQPYFNSLNLYWSCKCSVPSWTNLHF